MMTNSSSSLSSPDYSLCIVCNVEFDSNSKASSTKGSSKLAVGYRRMLKIFHKYLYFHLSTANQHKIKSNYTNCIKANLDEDSEESESFTHFCEVDGIPLPFCHNCRNIVSQLCDLHRNLESVQQNIKKTVAHISSTMVQTEKPIKRENGSDSVSLVKATRKIRTAQYRKRILQNLNPQISLVDCISLIKTTTSKLSPTTSKNKKTDENDENMGIVIKATWSEKNKSNSKKKKVENDLLLPASSINNDDFDGGDDDHLSYDNDDENDIDFMTMFTDTSMHQTNENQRNEQDDEDYNIDPRASDEEEEEEENTRRNSTLKKKKRGRPAQGSSNSRRKKIKSENGENPTRRKYKKRENIKLRKVKPQSITICGPGKLLYKDKWPFIKSDSGFKCSICAEFHANIPLMKVHMDEFHSQFDPSQIQEEVQSEEQEASQEQEQEKLNKIITLEETLPKDFPSTNKTIVRIGPGQFLYKDNWLFYLHPDGDSFVCHACGFSHPISQKGGNQIAYNIVKHIKRRHVAAPAAAESPTENNELNADNLTGNNVSKDNVKKIGIWSREISPGQFMWGKWPFSKIEGGYLCGTCPATRIQRNKMTSHIRIVHESYKAFICEICGIGHNSRSLLKIHQASHSTEKQFICEICARPYKEKTGLIIHRKRVHNLTSNAKPRYTFGKHSNSSQAVTCEKCGKSYSTSVRLQNHLKTCGLVREKVYQPYKPRPKPIERVVCPLCNKTYADKRVLAIHLDRHNNVQKHFCDVCNLGFLHKWQMTKHKSEEHVLQSARTVTYETNTTATRSMNPS